MNARAPNKLSCIHFRLNGLIYLQSVSFELSLVNIVNSVSVSRTWIKAIEGRTLAVD